jgi:hypothetical protein
MTYSDEECLSSLRTADQQIEGKLSRADYRKLDFFPCAATLTKRFGGWNQAKKEAGLTTFDRGCPTGLNDDRVKVDYFTKINSPEKAYWLGVLAGDGCVEHRSGNRYRVELGLQERNHVERFKAAVESNHTIYQSSGLHRIEIGISAFVKPLIKRGINPKKTNNYTDPQILPKFEADYVRGYIDADGHIADDGRITLSSDCKPRLEAVGEVIPSPFTIYERQERESYQLKTRALNSKEMKQYLYYDGEATNPALPRKKSAFF